MLIHAHSTYENRSLRVKIQEQLNHYFYCKSKETPGLFILLKYNMSFQRQKLVKYLACNSSDWGFQI